MLKLTPWSWVLLMKPPVSEILRNFPTFYGTWRFIIMFTRTLHWSLSWARWIQSIPFHSIYVRPILILSSRLRLCLPNGLVPSVFPTNNLYAFFFYPKCATWHAHLIILDLIILFCVEYKLWSSALCKFFQSRSSSSFFSSNITNIKL
jgi:hypothetical protein